MNGIQTTLTICTFLVLIVYTTSYNSLCERRPILSPVRVTAEPRQQPVRLYRLRLLIALLLRTGILNKKAFRCCLGTYMESCGPQSPHIVYTDRYIVLSSPGRNRSECTVLSNKGCGGKRSTATYYFPLVAASSRCGLDEACSGEMFTLSGGLTAAS